MNFNNQKETPNKLENGPLGTNKLILVTRPLSLVFSQSLTRMSIHIRGFKTFVSLYIGWSNDGMIQLKPESRERNMGQIGKNIATLYRRKCQPKWSFSKGKSFLFAGKSEGCWNFCNLARWLEVGRWILHFFLASWVYFQVWSCCFFNPKVCVWGPPVMTPNLTWKVFWKPRIWGMTAMTSFSWSLSLGLDRSLRLTDQAARISISSTIPLGVPTLKTNILYVGILDVSPFPTMRQFLQMCHVSFNGGRLVINGTWLQPNDMNNWMGELHPCCKSPNCIVRCNLKSWADHF